MREAGQSDCQYQQRKTRRQVRSDATRTEVSTRGRPGLGPPFSERPGCEGVFSCLQCGACSGTCPLSIYMDFSPRRIIALVREGFRQDALGCKTIWLCASCYSCSVHCPRQIHITDVMYSLKREAIQIAAVSGALPDARAGPGILQDGPPPGTQLRILAGAAHGAARRNPLILFGMWRTGWDLLRTGRLSLRRERIRDVASLPRGISLRGRWRDARHLRLLSRLLPERHGRRL